jgi:signal transduction histidine kinase
MWRAYAWAWLAYVVVVTLANQLDGLSAWHFDWSLALESGVGTVGQGLLLALVWPLTGRLERGRHRPAATASIHAGMALAFGAAWITLWILSTPNTKPLGWYVWPFLYNVMMYTVIAGIFHSVRANQNAHRHTVAMHQAQSLLIASELNALRSKLNPHFLFNTLHSIIALTRKDSSAAEAALFQFSDMLRYVLDTEKNGNERVTLDDELRFMRDYLELEALRLGERLAVEWDVEAAAGGHSLPALSLQPLVENSIKHAFNPHSRPGKLLIRTRLDAASGQLRLTVSDDGPGASAERIRASNGLGLRTVERRLLLEYGPRAVFHIETAPGAGFTASVSIPTEPG